MALNSDGGSALTINKPWFPSIGLQFGYPLRLKPRLFLLGNREEDVDAMTRFEVRRQRWDGICRANAVFISSATLTVICKYRIWAVVTRLLFICFPPSPHFLIEDVAENAKKTAQIIGAGIWRWMYWFLWVNWWALLNTFSLTLLPVLYRQEAQCWHSRMISTVGRKFDLFYFFWQLGFWLSCAGQSCLHVFPGNDSLL